MGDLEIVIDNGTITVDRSIRSLRCLCLWEKTQSLGCTGLNILFKMNDLPESKKVNVAMVSFSQDEVYWYRWSSGCTGLNIFFSLVIY